MDSCTSSKGTSGFLPSTAGFANATTGLLQDPAVSQALTAGSTTYSWGTTAVSGLGRTYSLCYAASGGNSLTDYTVELGTLSVPGPSAQVAILCTAGRRCDFAVDYAASGQDLGNGDRVAAFSACPSGGASQLAVSGWPNFGISEPATNGGRAFWWNASKQGNGTMNTWVLLDGADPAFQVAPARYRLCWCHRNKPCNTSSDFRQDIGSLDFAGPVVSTTAWECIRGRTCVAAGITGAGLAVDDVYAVLQTCGRGSIVPGFTTWQIVAGSVTPAGSLIGGTAASVQWSAINASAGVYSLCWAAAWQPTSKKSCSTIGWSSSTVGSPAVCLGAASNGASCTSLSLATAEQACSTLGARLCLPHELVQGAAVGTACSNVTDAWTSRRCGTGFEVVSQVGQVPTALKCQATAAADFAGVATSRPAPCCADVTSWYSGSAASYFQQSAVYRTTVGTLAVRGPFQQDAYCVLNDTCIFDLQGIRLNSTEDFVQVVGVNQTCGASATTLASASFQNPRTNASLATVNASLPRFTVGQALAFGTFGICWCTTGGGGRCSQTSDFNVFVGALLVGGMLQQTVYCVFKQPCAFTLAGTNLGGSDALMVATSATSCSEVRITQVTPEVSVNPAETLDQGATQNKTFDLGNVSRHDSYLLCYCINFNTRGCFDSRGQPLMGNFNMQAGRLEIWGPYVNVTLPRARAGAPYTLTLGGRLLQRANRVAVISGPGSACGMAGANVSDPAVYFPYASPSFVTGQGDAATWNDVQIFRAGNYTVCWCLGDPGLCTSAADYRVFAATLVVDGLSEGRPTYLPPQVVGNPFTLTMFGTSLLVSDNVTFVPANLSSGAAGPGCGQASTLSFGDLSQGVSGAPVVINGTQQVWRSVVVTAVGQYLVCWCGRAACTKGEHYNIRAAMINVLGPQLTLFPTAVAGEPFSVTLQGAGLTPDDRISLVLADQLNGDAGVPCGTPQASFLASTVVPPAKDVLPNATAAEALGPPALVGDSGTQQVWRGLRIRWHGLYRVCWAGNYSFSRRCLRFDNRGNCTSYVSANHPYEVGTIRVDDGNISFAGVTQIARCQSLQIIAQPPRAGLADNAAAYAKWTCEPGLSEVCQSLQVSFLNTQAAMNRLALQIPAETIASALDRARYVATGLGTDWRVLNLSLSVSLIDAQNVTRFGSQALTIFAGVPQVSGVPQVAQPRLNVDTLDLAVYVYIPGGDVCTGQPVPPPGAFTVTWRMEGAPLVDLGKLSSSADPLHLVLSAVSVRSLGPGSHNITALVNFTNPAFAPQVVPFLVQVVQPPSPVVRLAVPAVVPAGCPVVLDASATSDALLPSGPFFFQWGCNASAGGPCPGPVGPDAIGNGSATAHQVCQDLDTSGVRDGGGDGCSAYKRHPSQCGAFDDADFTAGGLCCACGGGTITWADYDKDAVHLIMLPEQNATGPLNLSARVAVADGRVGQTVQAPPVAIAEPGPLNESAWPAAVRPVPTQIGTSSGVLCAATAPQAGGDVPAHCGAPAGAQWVLEGNMSAGEADRPLNTTSMDAGASGGTASALVAFVPPSMLTAGGVYRCVLRVGDVEVFSTDQFSVGMPPAKGRVILAPYTGQALVDRFTLTSFGWTSDNLPLEHSFSFLAGSSDAVRQLRGWSADSQMGCVFGQPGRLRVVASARDTLGSMSQASSYLQVTAAGSSSFANVSGLLASLAASPPNAKAVAVAAAALLDTLQASSQASAPAAAAAMLEELWASTASSQAQAMTSEDLALRSQVLQRALALSRPLRLTPAQAASAGSLLELTAEQASAISSSAEKDPIADGAATDLLSSLALLADPNVSGTVSDTNGADVVRQARSADYYVGAALTARARRREEPGSSWEAVSSSGMRLSVGRVTRGTGALVPVQGQGLSLQLPAPVPRSLRRRLAAAPCDSPQAEVQLTRWVYNPMRAAASLAAQLGFEGAYAGMKAAAPEEATGRRPAFAALRLWDCAGGLQPPAVAQVTFEVQGGIDTESSEVQRLNGSDLLTLQVNVSWVCAQWDANAAMWRAVPAMLGAVNSAAFTVDCRSQWGPTLGGGPGDADTMYLAVVPAVQALLLRSEPAIKPAKDPGLVYRANRLPAMISAALLVQLLLVGLCACGRHSGPQQSSTAAAAAAKGAGRASLLTGGTSTDVYAHVDEEPDVRESKRGFTIGHSELELEGSARKGRRGGSRLCVCFPTIRLFAGLYLIRPIRLWRWWCTKPRNGGRGKDEDPSEASSDEEVSVKSRPWTEHAALDGPLRGADASVAAADPPLRPEIESAVVGVFNGLKADQARRKAIEAHGLRTFFCGLLVSDVRQREWRTLVFECLAVYRKLMLSADRFNLMQRGIQKGVFRASMAAAKDEPRLDSEIQSEAFQMRVAHHVQMMVLQLAVARDRGFQLSHQERELLWCCQNALEKWFETAEAPPPSLQGEFQPQPFYAPPGAVRVVLVSVHIGDPPRTGRRRPDHYYNLRKKKVRVSERSVGCTDDESDSEKKGGAAEAGSVSPTGLMDRDESGQAVLSAVVPTATTASAFVGGASVAPSRSLAAKTMLKQAEALGRCYLPGCAYYLWTHGDTLMLQRAEALLQDSEVIAPLNHALSAYDPAVAFSLAKDVQDLRAEKSDDRHIFLSVRGVLHLRFRGEGEVRAWVDTAAREGKSLRQESPAGSPTNAAASTAEGRVAIGDCLYRYVPGASAEEGAKTRASFFYPIEAGPPHTASTVHVQTVSQEIVPALMWYSHGGAVLSLALLGGPRPPPPMPAKVFPPGAVPPGDDEADISPRREVPSTTAKAVGAYLSEIGSIEYTNLEEPSDASRRHRYCMVVCLTDGVQLRLLFASRFARLAFQGSLARLRAAVHPAAADLPVVAANSPRKQLYKGLSSTSVESASMAEAPSLASSAITAGTADSKKERKKKPRGWTGLSGTLELRILSGSNIGRKESETGRQLRVMQKFQTIQDTGRLELASSLPLGLRKTGQPQVQLGAFVPTQPPPKKPNFRLTPDFGERTGNPIWDCTWYYTVEYSANDPPPADIILEVHDNAGNSSEYIGEIAVPFPRQVGCYQYHLPLQNDPAKALDFTYVPTGSVSVQLSWRADSQDVVPRILSMDPATSSSVCGRLGFSCIRALGLRSADFTLSSDPYCIVHVGVAPQIHEQWRTSTILGTVNPEWNELREFQINWPKADWADTACVKMEVWDWDRFGKDEFLGEVVFPLPAVDGDTVLDLEVKPNPAKGSGIIKGRMQIRLYFRDEFKQSLETEKLTPYEQAFCSFFGTRAVDEQMARTVAPALLYFHCSTTRLLKGQVRWAWHRATCGLVDAGPAFAPGLRVRGYWELTSYLWSSLAVVALILLASVDRMGGDGLGGAIVGVIVGLAMPNPAWHMTQLFWHDPSDPANCLQPPPRPAQAQEDRLPPRSYGVPLAISIPLLVLSVVWLWLFIGYKKNEQAMNVQLSIGATLLVLVRLLVLPLGRAVFLTAVVISSKRSRGFDWILWCMPTALAAHDAVW